MRHLESRLQAACVRWARLQFPECRKLLFAVPNGYRTSVTQARIAKEEGLVSGVADLLFLHPSADGNFAGLCIEFKTEKGRQSPNQKEWQRAIERTQIYRYEIVRTFGQFQRLLTEHLCVVRCVNVDLVAQK